jgi:hypothetical protein
MKSARGKVPCYLVYRIYPSMSSMTLKITDLALVPQYQVIKIQDEKEKLKRNPP